MRENSGEDCENSVKMGRIGYRPYWALNLSILIRAAHQVGAAVFLAAYLLDAMGRRWSMCLSLCSAAACC